tara:strand:+ start:584 stop:1603 length:1020 start_codon:yes stop_codon:yes gene_type:complete
MLKTVSQITGSVQDKLQENITLQSQIAKGKVSLPKTDQKCYDVKSDHLKSDETTKEIRNKSSESDSYIYSSESDDKIGLENTIKTSLLYSINLMNNSIESITSIGTVQTETEEDEFKCQCFGRCNCTTVYSGILDERHSSFTERTITFEKQFNSLTLIQPGDKLFINTDNTVELDRGLVISDYTIPIPGLQKLTRYYYNQDRQRTNIYLKNEIEKYMRLLTDILNNLERFSTNPMFRKKYFEFKKIIERNLKLIHGIILGLYNLKKTYTENDVCVFRPLEYNIDSIILTFMDFIEKIKKTSSDKFEGGIGSGIQLEGVEKPEKPLTVLEQMFRERSGSF